MTKLQIRVKEIFENKGYEVSLRYSHLICTKKELSLAVVVSPLGYTAYVKKDLWNI